MSISSNVTTADERMQPDPTGPARNPRQGDIYTLVGGGLLILLAVILGFSITRRGAFLADDLVVVNQLAGSKSGFFDNLGYFASDWGVGAQFYRPWVRLGYYFQYQLFGQKAGWWHLTSVGLHLVNALLVMLIVKAICRRNWAGILAGLIFALQPIHTESVAWISGQTDLWATLFVLSSFLSFVYWRKDYGRGWYFASIGLFVMALFSKEAAVALPVALLVYDFVTGGINRLFYQDENTPHPRSTLRRLALQYSPYLVLLVLYFALRFALFGGLGGYTAEAGQSVSVASFWRTNLNWMVSPFSLSGMDGLILVGLIGAFFALTIVQERERWRIRHGIALEGSDTPKPARRRAIVNDGELDDPDGVAAVEVAPVVDEPSEARPDSALIPPYNNLRLTIFGFIWVVVFLLPAMLTQPAERLAYLPSAGFAFFLGTILTPFGSDRELARRANTENKYALTGFFDISNVMRIAAIIVLLGIYLATTSTRVAVWMDASFTAQRVLTQTKAAIPSVVNHTLFVVVGVPRENTAALIFRTGYPDALQLLYDNRTIEVVQATSFPIVSGKLNNAVFLEYLPDRVIDHYEIRTALLKRNEVLKQDKDFVNWDFANRTATVSPGEWMEANGGLAQQRDNTLVVSSSGPIELQSPGLNLKVVQAGPVEVTMKVNGNGQTVQGNLGWLTTNDPTFGSGSPQGVRNVASFDITADGQYHTYKIRPDAAAANFSYTDQLVRFRLRLPANLGDVFIQSVKQKQLPFEYQLLTR